MAGGHYFPSVSPLFCVVDFTSRKTQDLVFICYTILVIIFFLISICFFYFRIFQTILKAQADLKEMEKFSRTNKSKVNERGKRDHIPQDGAKSGGGGGEEEEDDDEEEISFLGSKMIMSRCTPGHQPEVRIIVDANDTGPESAKQRTTTPPSIGISMNRPGEGVIAPASLKRNSITSKTATHPARMLARQSTAAGASASAAIFLQLSSNNHEDSFNVSHILREGGAAAAAANNPPIEASANSARLRAKAAIMAKTKKAVLRSVLVILVYVGCWTPYLGVIAYELISGNHVPPILDACACWLTNSNSLWDFFLVLWMDDRFKHGFRSTVTKRLYGFKRIVKEMLASGRNSNYYSSSNNGSYT